MDAIDAALEVAEFEETWLEVQYHEGRATLADVEQAMERVNELRRLASEVALAGEAGMGLPWPAARSLAPASH